MPSRTAAALPAPVPVRPLARCMCGLPLHRLSASAIDISAWQCALLSRRGAGLGRCLEDVRREVLRKMLVAPHREVEAISVPEHRRARPLRAGWVRHEDHVLVLSGPRPQLRVVLRSELAQPVQLDSSSRQRDGELYGPEAPRVATLVQLRAAAMVTRLWAMRAVATSHGVQPSTRGVVAWRSISAVPYCTLRMFCMNAAHAVRRARSFVPAMITATSYL